MDPRDDERPGRFSPDALYTIWLMAVCFLSILGLVAAAYVTSFLSGR